MTVPHKDKDTAVVQKNLLQRSQIMYGNICGLKICKRTTRGMCLEKYSKIFCIDMDCGFLFG